MIARQTKNRHKRKINRKHNRTGARLSTGIEVFWYVIPSPLRSVPDFVFYDTVEVFFFLLPDGLTRPIVPNGRPLAGGHRQADRLTGWLDGYGWWGGNKIELRVKVNGWWYEWCLHMSRWSNTALRSWGLFEVNRTWRLHAMQQHSAAQQMKPVCYFKTANQATHTVCILTDSENHH